MIPLFACKVGGEAWDTRTRSALSRRRKIWALTKTRKGTAGAETFYLLIEGGVCMWRERGLHKMHIHDSPDQMTVWRMNRKIRCRH